MSAALFNNIPEDLRARRQWIVWRREQDAKGKPIKPPYRVDGRGKASSTDPSTWSTYEAAVKAAANGFAGIGYALTAEDGFAFLDLDGVIDDGVIHPEADRIVRLLDSYTERSQSGVGLHVLVRAELNGGGHATSKTAWKDELAIYTQARFVYVTGDIVDGRTSIEERQHQLQDVCETVLAPKDPPAPKPRAVISVTADDHELLAKAFKAKNGSKLQALYRGDASGYPSESEADLALAGMLAFWAGPDPERIEHLMRGSGLTREKWDKRPDYLRDTIEEALRGRREFWAGAKRELSDLTVEDIVKASGVDPEAAEDAESIKDLLKLMKGGGQKIADRVVELVKEAGVELFHAENRVAFAMYEVDDHVETQRIGSKDFALYMRRLYHREEGSVLPAQARKDAEGTLEAMAVFDGEMLPVHLRIAGDAGTIYIDLGDEHWSCIRITAAGWEVLQRHAVRFRRTAGMGALPIPERGGSLDRLLALLNLKEDADADRRLLIGWLLGAARPDTPYPVLELVGEEGTAKSTAARALRAMIDPNSTPLRRCPSKSDDLFVSAYASHVAAFDNVSGLQPWLSDDLCRLATGGGQSKRELFTDDGEHLIDVRRPVILNGIEEIATKGDLLRRTLRVELPVIEDEHRQTEEAFWTEFESIRPHLLGALCDALSCALRRVDEVELDRMPSMADLAKWVTAAEPALGWDKGAFMTAFDGRRTQAHEVVIESERCGPYIRQVADTGFDGTATDLLTKINELVDGNVRREKDWPKSARKLAGVIKRLAPALRKLGYEVVHGGHTREGSHWTLYRKAEDES